MKLALAGPLVAVLALGACERTMRDMYDQPRYKPLSASPLWDDGRASRAAVAGAVPRLDVEVPRLPVVPTTASLARGRERFDIFCSPCHGAAGDGDGMIVRRGFPRPPSFHTDALRAASDAHLYAVITEGYGVMFSYATRVPPEDRAAIVGYIRALQLSRNASLAEVPEPERAWLSESAGKR